MKHHVLLLDGRKKLALPYTFTPVTDGPLPSPWIGSTWTIASSLILNTPGTGANLLTDPGLEANYTGGLCDSLVKNGGPTVTESADVHGGSKAQAFTATALNDLVRFAAVAGVAATWYRAGIWAKRTAGSNNNTVLEVYQANAKPVTTLLSEINDAAYTQKMVSFLSTTTDNIWHYCIWEAGSSSFNSVIGDDGTLYALTYSTLFALLNSSKVNVVVKARPYTLADNTYFGAVARADATSSPTNCLFALMRRYPVYPTSAWISLWKKIGNTYTQVIAETEKTIVAHADLEIRTSGTTISLWYNNAQVSTDQTVSDAVLQTGQCVGMFNTGGNKFERFFVSAN